MVIDEFLVDSRRSRLGHHFLFEFLLPPNQSRFVNPTKNPDYNFGYGGDHIEVVLPAFLAAYTNKSVDNVNLDIFKTIPLPNWQINYNGLSKIGFLKNIVTDLTERRMITM